MRCRRCSRGEKMWSRTGHLLQTCLLLSSAFAWVHGRGQGTEPSCDAALFVRSGTVVEAAPGQKVALICPVEPCGEDVKVSWCKVQSIECKVIFETKDVEIAQIGSSRDPRWHSYLHFKRISLEDAGLYRCFINEDQSESEMISNGITVKVSAGESPDPPTDHDDQNQDTNHSTHDELSWLPFIVIGVGISALVTTVIVLPIIKGYCQKRTMTFSPVDRQERPSHMIPDLPPRGAAPTLVQQHQPIFVSSFTGMPTPQLNVTADAPRPDAVVYSGINHPGMVPGGGYYC